MSDRTASAAASVRDPADRSWGGPRDTIALRVDQMFYEAGPDIDLALGNFRPQLPRTDDYVQLPEYLALLRIAMDYMRVDTIDLLDISGTVEEVSLRGRAQQRLVRVLAVDIHQELARLAQLRQRGGVAVDEAARAPGRVDRAPEQHAPGIACKVSLFQPRR